MARSLLQRPFDLFICVLYGIQVPVAILLDSQAVLPKEWYPQAALQTMGWYVQKYQDPLMTSHDAWFRGIGYYELLVQVPFWTVAFFAYAADSHWIRLPNFVFSLCSLVLMIPIMSELLGTDKNYDRSFILPTYLPFVLAPAAIAIKTLACDNVWPQAQSSRRKKAV